MQFHPCHHPSAPGEDGEGTTVYRVYAETWATYSDTKKRQAARLFVRNNPRDCRGVDPERIPRYVDKAYGTDYPLATLASKVMLGHCELVQMGGARGPRRRGGGSRANFDVDAATLERVAAAS